MGKNLKINSPIWLASWVQINGIFSRNRVIVAEENAGKDASNIVVVAHFKAIAFHLLNQWSRSFFETYRQHESWYDSSLSLKAPEFCLI
ncbi:hypothetical protein A0J61_10250 [Choanephora cucurbitarum]|uniref:Uncharacterized protein n=1 Tax=Choanephora cucurbitarum TaxID=101091 RepID=A0A1C7MXZ4_9FUNG|nr:hypothetical protein A0J61_10250 [Choanephora cucurbitarum]